ncbi:MAG: IS1595 family transposase [Devosia sp.]
MTDLTDPIFTDETKAREHFEATRWPDGAYCPFCGQSETVKKLGGKSMGPGWYHCSDCRRKFTALVGTVCERSHIPLTKWLMAMQLMCASKKGMSAHQLHRMLGVTYKSAWFMAHRIREAMRELHLTPLGGEGKTVEVDETYVGGKEKNKHRNKRANPTGGSGGKEIVFSLVERNGKVRSHHIADVSAKTLRPILEAQIDAASHVYSDTGGARVAAEFPNHGMVNHSIGEYVRGPVHSNTVEGYFATLKRGIIGTYHHVSQQHLKRYLGEFDFRYNERAALGVSDAERTQKAIAGTVGKRVTYQETGRTGA